MEKQISKKKLERMAISGGNFAAPGQRRGDFTVDDLKGLLTDDVKLDEHAESDGPSEKVRGETHLRWSLTFECRLASLCMTMK